MDPFDAMLRERLARLVTAAPADAARPLLAAEVPPATWRHAWKVRSGQTRASHGTWFTRLLLGGLATAALLVAAATGLTWSLTDPRVPADTVPVAGAAADEDAPIVWDSGLVRLQADSLHIETNGKVFTAEGIVPDSVSSDPGNGSYRTFEVTWHEDGVEMRLNIYLAADDQEWWATEVRVYDGSVRGDWIGWGGSYKALEDSPRPLPRGGVESRLRAFGVPAGAEVVAAAADGAGNFDSVTYRDWRGHLRTIGCDRRSSTHPTGPEEEDWRKAPAELCGPPPVDLGLFRSPRGEAWAGDLDLVDAVHLAGGDRWVGGELRIRGLWLSAFE